MEEVFLKTNDGIKLALNHYKNGSKSLIIIAHGWFMTKDSKAFRQMAKEFSKNYDVITFDFRGHGKSSGFYTFTTKETIDLKCVVDYAKNMYEKIYLIGFSLGGALVLIHAAKNKDIDKIIAVSAPCDFDKIENKMWKKEAFIPTLKKFEPERWLSIRPSCNIQDKIKPIDIVKDIDVPILFIAGKKDPTVHAWHTLKLYKNAKSKKQFELFEKGTHAEDLFLDEPKRFMKLCLNFLDCSL